MNYGLALTHFTKPKQKSSYYEKMFSCRARNKNGVAKSNTNESNKSMPKQNKNLNKTDDKIQVKGEKHIAPSCTTINLIDNLN